MATKWTPEVIAREAARKQAANVPLNHGRMPPSASATLGGSVVSKPTPSRIPGGVSAGAVPQWNVPNPPRIPGGVSGTPQMQKLPFNPANGVPKPQNLPMTPGMTPKMTPLQSQPMAATSTTSRGAIPPIYNAANNGGQNPALGFGSGGTYGQTAGLGSAYAANSVKLKDPAFRQSEIDRTQSVIAARKAQGLDTSGQEKYLTVNLGFTPTGAMTPQVATPPEPKELTPQEIAAAEQAEELARRERYAQEQIAGLTSSFGRSNQIIGDNRTLENLQIDRTLNPFSGKTSYDKGIIGRERTLADEASLGQFNSQIAGINGGLEDFRNGMQGQISARAQELEQQAYQRQLQEAELTGTFNGQPTRAMRNDQFNQGLATRQLDMSETEMMAALTGRLPNGQKTTAKQQQDLENMWIAAEQTGTIPNVLADLYGIRRGTQTRAAREFAEQMALGWDNNAISWDNNARGWDSNDLGWAQEDWKQMNPTGGQEYRGFTAGQVEGSVKSLYSEPIYETDIYGEKKKIGDKITTDPKRREQMFLDVWDYGLPSDAESRQVLMSLGFNKKEIEQLEAKWGK